jgi:alpha-amylase/alpha-mannosidase (GH57 family)
MTTRCLDLVFLWHMHQPDYRDHASGEHLLPWTYLHAIKDYTDMAAHFERHPSIRAVVNFVPVLLDQIEDYCRQIESGHFRDPLLRLLATPDLAHINTADRKLLLDTCFRSNHHTMLAPFPRYQRLHDLYQRLASDGEAALAYLSGNYFADLVTWYHLSWTGETERRRRPMIAELMNKAEGYTVEERQALLHLFGDILKNLVPRYRALQERGQIELSATPETHPLAPLLLDFQSARESLSKASLPEAVAYGGGQQRLTAHIEAARASHARRFGAPPVGMWPAEGAVSTDVVQQFAEHGCAWLATSEGVLRNSLVRHGGNTHRAAYRPWTLPAAPGVTLFFRDERLSDLIGFEYAKWHGRDAAHHLVGQLEGILADSAPDERPVVSIILDGENAWEHYPYNAAFFFEDLYDLLEQHPRIRTTTFAEILARPAVEQPVAAQLPGLTAGSWVYGTLSTWIGDDEKNYAWDLLCTAKQCYDTALGNGSLTPEEASAAERQLAICESSDWFWWFGGYNPSQAVANFDRLYRRNLVNLYHLLKMPPPAQLDLPISRGSDTATTDGTMRRAQEHHS